MSEGGLDELDRPEGLDQPVVVRPVKPALEAVLMVADQPLDSLTLAAAVGHPPEEVALALSALAEEYAAQDRGSTSARSRAAGATTRVRSTPRSWSGSSWTASRPG